MQGAQNFFLLSGFAYSRNRSQFEKSCLQCPASLCSSDLSVRYGVLLLACVTYQFLCNIPICGRSKDRGHQITTLDLDSPAD